MIIIDGNSLQIEEVYRVANKKEEVRLGSDAKECIIRSHKRLLNIVKQNKPVYGINTGFGIFANKTISIDDSKQLNRNLILSHSVGTGDFLPVEYVRAAMLIRANALAKGYSGIRYELVETLINMLNKDVVPAIRDKGSLGSSGDLCMLAQMSLVLSCNDSEKETDSGQVFFNGELISGFEGMTTAGIPRQVLSYKDGLALINGATFSAALLTLVVESCHYLCLLSDISAALSLEALLGKSDAFNPVLHQVRGIQGQIDSSQNILKLIEGSSMVDLHLHLQDAYSLRCIPQVHGAVREMLKNAESIITCEINAATDNPLIIDNEKVISGGNFHGEPIGIYADALSIAMAELAAISERRTFRLLDSSLNHGLPEMLVDEESQAGLNSGTMMTQYTAAALVLENQTLASPDSVRSLPTSANQEDHNANAYLAAYHASKILENCFKVISIELLNACRAVDIRRKINPAMKLGKGTQKAFDLVRSIIPYEPDDAVWGDEIDKLHKQLFIDWQIKEEILQIVN